MELEGMTKILGNREVRAPLHVSLEGRVGIFV